MADWEDVRKLALAMPETDEHISRGHVQWRVKEKLFVWERPLRKGDIAALGDQAPKGPIIGARVEHEIAKTVLVESRPDLYLTIPHFDGYPAILARLDRMGAADLEELVVEAWLVRAPARLAARYMVDNGLS